MYWAVVWSLVAETVYYIDGGRTGRLNMEYYIGSLGVGSKARIKAMARPVAAVSSE